MDLFIGILAVIISFLGILYAYFKYSYTYWKRKSLVYLEPSFPFGNIKDTLLQKKASAETFQDIYNKLEGHDYAGAYTLSRPVLIVREPELIKDILVKNFTHFQDHGTYFDEQSDPLMAHLFMLSGQKWRNLRIKLTPTFTSGKIKSMFPILTECGKELETCLDELVSKDDVVEVKDVLARFTTDIIASCAFGVRCNCLEDSNAEFRNWGRKIFDTSIKSGIRNIAMFVSPTLSSLLKIPFVPKDVTDYFRNMVRETIQYRQSNNVLRNDFMQLLMQLLNNQKADKNETANGAKNSESEMILTLDDIAAQAFVFFIGGFETSSTVMSFCLYELALNVDIQKKVQQEIDAVLKKHNGQVTYEAVLEMNYLDMVISESLRKYPPVGFLVRECTKNYPLPGKNVTLEKGMLAILPIFGMQRDPKYFPEPEKFDPERFTEEAKTKRHTFAYLPFGEGPRICIGMRFGLLQTKMGLASWLRRYEVHVSDKTPIPLKLDKMSFITTAEGGMWLKTVRRN